MIQHDMRTRVERRNRECPVLVDRRVRELDRRRDADHSIAVGPISQRFGWVRARCSCGAELSARVEGLAEQWAMWHLDEVAAPAGVKTA